MEVDEMKIYKPVAVRRTSQSPPPHIPREMPAIYQLLDGVEEGVKLLKIRISGLRKVKLTLISI
ncbi:MAG: hypothetical protein ACXU99_10725, partial [Thermodesulfobacteriota bacterium]